MPYLDRIKTFISVKFQGYTMFQTENILKSRLNKRFSKSETTWSYVLKFAGFLSSHGVRQCWKFSKKSMYMGFKILNIWNIQYGMTHICICVCVCVRACLSVLHLYMDMSIYEYPYVCVSVQI